MPNFTAGTSFADGVTNDVTAAKLNALIADAVPTSSLSLNSTTGTIANFSSSTANITNGTITTLTNGTTTATAEIITSGTIGNLSTTLVGDFTISQGTATLATTGATAGTYGTTSDIPRIIVDAKGRITSASTVTAPVGFRNRIINGDMRIDQRNAGASVSNGSGANAGFVVDRWNLYGSQASKLTGQQNAGSVTPPAGFKNYAGITSSSAYSVLTGDYFSFYHRVEGFNTSDLEWGTANASSITLSFWVRSSLTGTFGGALSNNAFNRSYPFTYTISTANTWEKKTLTIAGDTTGTWETNNSIGISVYFGLGAGATYSGTAGAWTGSGLFTSTGATSVVGTSGATFYITGVQLEAGSTATDFERRPYGTELALCQRYLLSIGGTSSVPWANPQVSGSSSSSASVYFLVTMRSAPTLSVSGIGFNASDNSLGPVTATISLNAAFEYGATLSYAHSALTGNASRALLFSNSSSYLRFSAEL